MARIMERNLELKKTKNFLFPAEIQKSFSTSYKNNSSGCKIVAAVVATVKMEPKLKIKGS
jgi:hypothetical protein